MSLRIYLVQYTLSDARRTPLTGIYRPDWVGPTKPEHNCAQIVFPENVKSVLPHQPVQGILIPLRPELWTEVKVGDVLESREGRTTTGKASILGTYDTPLPKRSDNETGRCTECQQIYTSRWIPGLLSGHRAPPDAAPAFEKPCPKCQGKVEPVS